MSWQDEPWHWLYRINAVLLEVARELANQYLNDVADEVNDDGTPWEPLGSDEIVRGNLEALKFWIEARLSGLDEENLASGVSSSRVPRWAGREWVDLEDW